ncbi:MAG: hypothetical protein EBR51_00030 [Gammaproteobacteria bacterium]|jgi:hypothetical protein|nr:hypothetical protein [Gammaproteobacteria bacterium]
MHRVTIRATAAVCALAFCALVSGASAELDDAVAPYLRRSGCTEEDISTTEACARNAIAATTGQNTCDNFAQLSPCWPTCLCEHPEGYAKLVQAYKPQCKHLPPCGTPAHAAKTHEHRRMMLINRRHSLLKRGGHQKVHAEKSRVLHAAARHRKEKASAYEKVWTRVKSREHTELKEKKE